MKLIDENTPEKIRETIDASRIEMAGDMILDLAEQMTRDKVELDMTDYLLGRESNQNKMSAKTMMALVEYIES